jgi:hypothetical protein
MAQNRFLQEFIRMQNKLVHEVAEENKGKKSPKSKHGTADGKAAFGEVTLSLLISEKPPKKDVVEYFRDRIQALVAEDLEMQAC